MDFSDVDKPHLQHFSISASDHTPEGIVSIGSPLRERGGKVRRGEVKKESEGRKRE
jgi:hypothetical protein